MSEEQIKSTKELNQTPVETVETNPANFDTTIEIHARLGVGKTDFTIDQLNENATVFMGSLKSMKPASIEGQYIKSIFYFYYHGSNHRCRKISTTNPLPYQTKEPLYFSFVVLTVVF